VKYGNLEGVIYLFILFNVKFVHEVHTYDKEK